MFCHKGSNPMVAFFAFSRHSAFTDRDKLHLRATACNATRKLILFTGIISILFVIQCIINAVIPQDAIAENVLKSCNEFKDSGAERPVILNGIAQSTDDVYADFVWLNMLYNADCNHPVRSTLEFNHYRSSNNFPMDLAIQIQNNIKPNTDYSRYWHGMTILLRPLLMFFTLKQIRWIFRFIEIALLIAFCIKCNNKRFSLCMVMTFIVSTCFFNLISLEYMPVFIIAFTALLILNKSARMAAEKFFVIGIVTAYFDFLTAETLTLTIPLLFCIYCISEYRDLKSGLRLALSWFLGYAGTMLSRCIIAELSGGDAMTHLAIRLRDIDYGFSSFGSKSPVLLNISQLFPFDPLDYRQTIALIVLSVVFLFSVHSVIRIAKPSLDNLLYLFIASIPLFRFAIIRDQSYWHYMFTYRALWATLLSIILFLDISSRKGRLK